MDSIEQSQQANQYQVSAIAAHTHNNTDSLPIAISSMDNFPHSSVQGSVLYFNGTAWATLSYGSSGQLLTTGTTPTWTGFTVDFGDGSDGSVSLSTNTTLTRDMFYSALTVGSSATLYPNGYRIFCSGTVTINSTISVAGGNGGAGGTGTTANGSGVNAAGGTAGTAGTGISSGTLKQPGNGIAGTVGMNGGANGNPNTENGGTGTSESNDATAPNGSNGGKSGSGLIKGGLGFTDNSSTGGIGGTATQVTKLASLLVTGLLQDKLGGIGINPTGGSGAGGGGGIGNNSNDARGGGGGGGGSGASGGLLWIMAKSIVNNGTLTAVGGNGGNGGIGGGAINAGAGGANYGAGGGGGGAGGNGGVVALIYGSLTNSGTITTAAGNSSTGGSGQSGGGSGNGGSAGTAGTTYLLQV